MQSSFLQVQARPACSCAKIEDRALLDQRHELPVPPLQLLEASEEPLRVHGGPGLAAIHLKDQLGYLLAFQVVEQGGPESVLRRIDHGAYCPLRPSATGRLGPTAKADNRPPGKIAVQLTCN
jgi:hypothetical protein